MSQPIPVRPLADFGGDPTREPMPIGTPHESAIEATVGEDDVHLVPGATVAGGRYRLLVSHGGPEHLRFWHAMDTALDRQVALTFVDPDAVMPDEELAEVLSQTTKLGAVSMPGVARILDVAHTGSGGLVVAEWVRGGSLAEVADTAPSAVGGARAVQSLAAAAAAAHRTGVALSIDHSSRIRVSIEGDVVLAFPATLPGASPEDDVRGVGATLYALLVDRWPLPETGTSGGLAAADRDPAGRLVEPRAVDQGIPFPISAAAARALDPAGGIRSASALLNLLQQGTAVADRTDLLAPVDGTAGADPGSDGVGPDPVARARRRRGVLIGVSAAGAVLVVVLVVLATVLSKVFGDVGGPLDRDQLGLNAPSSSSTGTTAAGPTVRPVRATVFSPTGEADNPGDAGLAIDGSAGTAWHSDIYTDAVPFPSFKDGVGLMLQLPQATTLRTVTVDLDSTGTYVQIRSAATPTPAALADTTELSPPTAMKPGSNTIDVSGAAPTANVLVWISTLGSRGGKSETAISEITLAGGS